jgi:hypothetical protein
VTSVTIVEAKLADQKARQPGANHEAQARIGNPVTRLLVLLLMGATVGLAQRPQRALPRHLEETSSVTVRIPDLPSLGETQCDESGSIYFQVFTGSLDKGTILKVSADGAKSTIYDLPTETGEGGRDLYQALSVTPSGMVRVLYQQEKTGSLYVGEFAEDGSLKGSTRLDAPDKVIGKDFVAFDDGTVWLSAYYAPRAAEALRGKRYAAVFDPSGRVIKQLESFLTARNFNQIGPKSAEGNVVLGKDGNLYVLAPDKVVVITESGKVLRRIKFTKTNPEQFATRIDASGGLLAITLTTAQKNEASQQFLLLDSFSGQPFGLYDLAGPERALLCFDRQDGFTFLGGDKSSTKFLHYALR